MQYELLTDRQLQPNLKMESMSLFHHYSAYVKEENEKKR